MLCQLSYRGTVLSGRNCSRGAPGPHGRFRTQHARVPGFSLLFVIYVAIGAVVGYTHDYWSNLNTFKEVASAILATLLWRLLLLGINLHIR